MTKPEVVARLLQKLDRGLLKLILSNEKSIIQALISEGDSLDPKLYRHTIQLALGKLSIPHPDIEHILLPSFPTKFVDKKYLIEQERRMQETKILQGNEIKQQHGWIVVYKLPELICNILSKYSKIISDVIKVYKETHPDILVDFIPYTIDNLHITIAQSSFIDGYGDEKNLNMDFSNLTYQDMKIRIGKPILTSDSLIIPTKSNATKHIINQIIAMNSYPSLEIVKAGRGTHITFGRFVGKLEDQAIIGEIKDIVQALSIEIDQSSLSLIDLKGSDVTARVIKHFFSSQEGSYFKLS